MAAKYKHFCVQLTLWIGDRNRQERGASLTEYALLVALLAVTCLMSIDYMGDVAAAKLSRVGASIGQP
jgi:Flp pilus assembly pilin Flp